MLGEASTTEIARNDNAHGMNENKSAARRGGKIAGDARKNLEKQTGRKVSVKDNYKGLTEGKKRNKARGTIQNDENRPNEDISTRSITETEREQIKKLKKSKNKLMLYE